MERLVTIEFGPSRSKRFAKELAEARGGPGECRELEPGRYRTRFLLGQDAAVYTGLARLLERVRHWRATEVYGEGELVSVFHAKEMAWCASFYLSFFGACREHFAHGVLPRCALCPLFDAERAIRAGMREGAAPRLSVGAEKPIENDEGSYEIVYGTDLLELLNWDLPEWIDADFLFPDFPPEEWAEQPDDEPAD